MFVEMWSIVRCTIFMILFAPAALSLECYVCEDQEDNEGKCAKTVQLCARDENYCLSLIKWGSMPYWTQGAPKQYFITKFCATKEICDQVRKQTLPRCERIGYNDWECSECCEGDRCNYFVTLAGSSLKFNWTITVGAIFMTALLWIRIH